MLTVNALVAVQEVLIPLQAHFLALQGLSRLLDTVTLVRQRINPLLQVNGIVLCMHDASTRLASEVVDDLARFLEAARNTDVPWAGAKLYKTRVRRNIKLAESSSFGQTVFDYAPRSNGAIDYANLAAELVGDDILTPSDAAQRSLRDPEPVPPPGPEPQPAANQHGHVEQPPGDAESDEELEKVAARPWPSNVSVVNAPQTDTVISTS